MRRAFYGGIASLAVAGCTILVSTDDLSGGFGLAPDAGKRDARATPTDARDDARSEAGPGPSVDAAVRACPADALLCMDFENGFGSLEPHAENGSAVEIVTDIVHSGTHAYRATALARDGGPANQAELRLFLDPPFAPGDTIYFRAYVYLPARLPGGTTISKWRSSGVEDMNLKIDEMGRFKVDSDLATEGPELSGIDMAPVGRWTCVDWRATFGAPGHQLLNVDGTKQIDTNENNISANGYVEIGLGFVTANLSVQSVVLYDDVIVSKTLVGCP